MQTWFECKVRYTKVDQDGRERKVNEVYLLDAVSFTDAEARIIGKMQEMVRGEFMVTDIKKSNIAEIFSKEGGAWYFKVRISLITIDEEAGKEKKVNSYYLVLADDIKEALQQVEEGLSFLVVPYVITSIAHSTVVDVFPYFEGEGGEMIARED